MAVIHACETTARTRGTSYMTMCARNVIETAEWPGSIDDRSDMVSCVRCTKALSEIARRIGWGFRGIWQAAVAANAKSDMRCRMQAQSLRRAAEQAVSVLQDAANEGKRALGRLEELGDVETGADIAEKLVSQVAYIATNMRTDLLFKYAYAYDAAVERVREG